MSASPTRARLASVNSSRLNHLNRLIWRLISTDLPNTECCGHLLPETERDLQRAQIINRLPHALKPILCRRKFTIGCDSAKGLTAFQNVLSDTRARARCVHKGMRLYTFKDFNTGQCFCANRRFATSAGRTAELSISRDMSSYHSYLKDQQMPVVHRRSFRKAVLANALPYLSSKMCDRVVRLWRTSLVDIF